MTAASPGVIAHLPGQRATTRAARRTSTPRQRDEGRVRGDPPRPASSCSSTAPTWRWAATLAFADVSIAEFRKIAASTSRCSTTATQGHPARAACACTSAGATTKARTTTTSPLRDIVDIVLKARPPAISFEGANPRHEHEWAVLEGRQAARRQGASSPACIDSTTNFIEHPELVAQRIVRYAELVGRENVDRRHRLRLRHLRRQHAVDPRIAWAKLKALAEGARRASEELWRRAA